MNARKTTLVIAGPTDHLQLFLNERPSKHIYYLLTYSLN